MKTNMPQESQSGTPRTDAEVMHTLIATSPDRFSNKSVQTVLADFARTLERELNEAKRDADNCRQIIDTYSRQEDDLVKLAKQNHKEREALMKIAARDNHPVLNAEEAIVEARNALDVLDLSYLTVLPRAEIESWTCGCKWKETNNCFGDKELIGDKCTKHILLERFTK